MNKLTSLATALILFVSCSSKIPVISSIDPKIGQIGEVITLTGDNFGASRDESYVTIAGIAPTNSSYYLWQNNLIIVRVPELGESGLVYVHAGGKKSNGVLFSNSASVPRPIEGEELGLEPKIVSVNPQTGTPGSLIIINGSNFGVSRENGGVFFSWDFESTSFNPYVVREPEFIEVSETELGYESWSAREIRVRLPDGAVSGNIEVRTPHGRSRPVFFDVSGRPGNKNLGNKRSYTISYSVDIKVLEATRPNTLYLWIPRPINSPSQRNVSLVSRSTEPFVENHRGVSLYKLDNMGTGASQSINVSFYVEVYAVETVLRPLSIRQESSPLSTLYTQSSSLIPSDNPQIMAAVSSITGREQNPYIKARALYDWVIANMQITETLPSSNTGIETALEQRRADSYTAALLYTAMARAAGLPCIPVAGVLIDRNGRTTRHYWTEFWIDGFGWVPADPVMGTRAVSKSFAANEDPANFYFGSMDNQRIAFSRGELNLSQIESRGRLVSHTHAYSLQNIWEESAGGLESYSSLWGDITISGIYVQ
jgi:transglutaminase-like putative cysteine protease